MRALHPDVFGLDQIRRHSLSLADTADAAGLDVVVPTCGAWTMADLVWHLLEVQHFWTFIISERPAGPEQYERLDRPPDGELSATLRTINGELLDALSGCEPSEPAWSWASDHSVGFTLRRQTHEAYVHHVDACMAASSPLPTVPAELGADGVDEVLRVMLSADPASPGLTVNEEMLSLHATDTGNTWTMAFGSIETVETFEANDNDNEEMTPARRDTLVLVESSAERSTAIRAPAVDLNLWIWGRLGADAVTVEGAPSMVTHLQQLIGAVAG